MSLSDEQRIRSLIGSETVFGLPRSHLDKQLSNYDWSTRPKLVPQVLSFVDALQAGAPPHLVMLGDVGTGKTHIAVGLYRWAVMQAGTMRCAFLNMPEFYKHVKNNYGTGYDALDELREADYLVVMDDPFASRRLHPGDLDILFAGIDIVYQNGAALVWTMNDDLKYLDEALPAHESDRILADAIVCRFSGESWR